MLLFEMKVMFELLTLLVMAPDWVIPVLLPAAVLFAVTVIFPEGLLRTYPTPLKTRLAAP